MDGPIGVDLLALLDQLPAVVWATDHEPRLTYARGAALKHFGPGGDEVLAAPLSARAHRAALDGTARTWEYEWRGRVFHAHVKPRWQGTTITGTIGVALDVSDRVQTHVLETVARLANAAAHEINNPLMVILAQVEMLAALVPATELHRIESCRLAIQRMSAIVHSMSRLTRLETSTGWPPDLPAMLDLHRSARPRD
jgi:signal transduction histidine kinase